MYQGYIDSAYTKLFFNLFEVNLVSNGGDSYVIVSICCAINKIFRVYTKSWKDFKEDYFLVTPFSIDSY